MNRRFSHVLTPMSLMQVITVPRTERYRAEYADVPVDSALLDEFTPLAQPSEREAALQTFRSLQATHNACLFASFTESVIAAHRLEFLDLRNAHRTSWPTDDVPVSRVALAARLESVRRLTRMLDEEIAGESARALRALEPTCERCRAKWVWGDR